MPDHGTLSDEKLGWYIQFQTDVLLQLPRPDEIPEDIAAGWHDNRGALKNMLYRELLPPKEVAFKPTPAPTILWIVEDDGRTNDEIVAAIEAKGTEVPDYVKQIVAKANEPVPPKGTVYRFVGIEGGEFATDAKRTTKNIFAAAARPERNYQKPSLRAGLLLREKFSQEQLGRPYVAVMSKPVRGAGDGPGVLALFRDDARDCLRAWYAYPGLQWRRVILFLFLAPQVSVQN